MAVVAAGNPAQAIAHFEAAVGVARRIGARPSLARTQFELAKVLAVQGNSAAAREHSAEALQLFELLGLAKHATKAGALCRELEAAEHASSALAADSTAMTSVNQFQRQAGFWLLGHLRDQLVHEICGGSAVGYSALKERDALIPQT